MWEPVFWPRLQCNSAHNAQHSYSVTVSVRLPTVASQCMQCRHCIMVLSTSCSIILSSWPKEGNVGSYKPFFYKRGSQNYSQEAKSLLGNCCCVITWRVGVDCLSLNVLLVKFPYIVRTKATGLLAVCKDDLTLSVSWGSMLPPYPTSLVAFNGCKLRKVPFRN